MLYKTGVEYEDYTMNFVLGCSHGCLFPCYAFLQEKRFGQIKDYADWCSPRLVSNALELLNNEIPRLKGKIVPVQLCFTTDPFMYGYQEIADMAIASIRKLNAAGIKCTVLTKGILPHEADGKEYRDHLFVSDTTGIAILKLNTWEVGTLKEEREQDDFVCFIRNPSRGAWSLCIPYEMDGEM